MHFQWLGRARVDKQAWATTHRGPWIALDVGWRRIGVAWSDRRHRRALPLACLQFQDGCSVMDTDTPTRQGQWRVRGVRDLDAVPWRLDHDGVQRVLMGGGAADRWEWCAHRDGWWPLLVHLLMVKGAWPCAGWVVGWPVHQPSPAMHRDALDTAVDAMPSPLLSQPASRPNLRWTGGQQVILRLLAQLPWHSHVAGLEHDTAVPVYYQDERRTTVHAHQVLASQGRGRVDVSSGCRDSMAATLILDTFLQRSHLATLSTTS